MKKSRMLAATLCAVLMAGVLTVPAYAGGGDEGCGALLVLFLRAGAGETQLAFGSLLRGHGGVVGCLGFIAFLLRYDSLLEEALHPVVGLAGDGGSGPGLRHKLCGGLYDLGAGAGVDLLVLRGGYIFHGLGLHQFGFGERRMDMHERVAGFHHIAFRHHEFDHASGQLA